MLSRAMERVREILAVNPPDVVQKHLFYFFMTGFSMFITYYSFSRGETTARRVWEAALYSACLLVILVSHEFGHYLQARKYRVEATLPFFIPMPFLSPFGTMGAFIRMKQIAPDRKALFDISFWGPGMSFLLSLPAVIIGILLSDTTPVNFETNGFLVGNTGMIFGNSILFDTFIQLMKDVPDGHALVLHPVAFAGWVGLFVTAINLFPIGQLDGGHIAYVFLGKRQQNIAYLFLAVLIFLAMEVSSAWILWVFLLIAMGIRHPIIRMRDARSHLDVNRVRLGLAAAMIFIISFIPEPLKMAPHDWEYREQKPPLPGELDPFLRQISDEVGKKPWI